MQIPVQTTGQSGRLPLTGIIKQRYLFLIAFNMLDYTCMQDSASYLMNCPLRLGEKSNMALFFQLRLPNRSASISKHVFELIFEHRKDSTFSFMNCPFRWDWKSNMTLFLQ